MVEMVSSILWRMLLFVFFFSSRRRHTRSLCDWSSDVCSSDLTVPPNATACLANSASRAVARSGSDGSEERRVGKGVDLGGRRIIKKKKKEERGKMSEVSGRETA